jgi:salicylate hydroxylase
MGAARPVVVVGAGIGGLTAALAFAKRGRDVVVVERAREIAEVGAGLQLSPNASRVLRDLGVGAALGAVAVEPEAIDVSSAQAGGLVSTLPLGPAIAATYGSPFLVAHRGDLQGVLLAAARRDPRIRILTATTAAAVVETGTGVRVDLDGPAGRDSLEAEAVIGADGVRSVLRTGYLGGASARYTGRMAWRTTIQAAEWDGDRRILSATGLWLGARAHMVHYPVRSRREINVIVAIEEPWVEETWDVPGDGAVLERRLAGWPDPPRRLVAAAATWRKWALCGVDPSGPWTRGRVALLGDAAHAMLPFAAQGAAMAIEDAAVLARLLCGDAGTVDSRLARYAAVRRPRVAAVVELARRNGAIYHLSGPAAIARDAAMRLMGPRRVLRRMDWIWRWTDG